MPEYFQRPENALRKAHEFLDVGKLKPALDVLSDVLRSKKHRTWQKIHEPIIQQYLDLCVQLRKSQAAKEGLYQYKIICQQVNTKSLEDAVTHYLNQAELKTKEAREKSAETALKMVEDLDMIESPEGMLLRVVTGEVTQDRTDRLMLTPWVKYLWESYRQCLDLLRNNSRVEKLYHNIAQQAFLFCLNYDRRTEFRKLCDNLRNHVKLSEQRHGAQFSVNLTNPETQSLHLETKIAQLDAAVHIELWQEAFKAVEDIHYLMSLSKRPPKPQTLANFHQKLSLVFWKADSMLFHACARHRLFHLTKDMKKNPSMDDLTRMASLMLVATLSIPITEQKHGIGKILDMEGTLIDKHLTLSKLLGLDRPPTRASLLDDFIRFNLLQYVPRQLRELYQWLEIDFHPLRLTERVQTTLQWIQDQTREPELVQYIPTLHRVVVSRVLQQVSKVYQSIEFSRLLKLLPFCTPFQLEQVIVDAARNGQLQVRIDHNRGSLSFGTDLSASPLYVEDEFFETQRLQALPSERVSERFNQMSRALLCANQMLNKQTCLKTNYQLQQNMISMYLKSKNKDHHNILQRKFIIEQRKEKLEHLNHEKELKELRAVQEQEEAVKEAEKARLDKEQKEREQRRKKELEKEEKRRNATDRLEMIKKSEIGQKILKDLDLDALDQINPDELMKKQMETMEREKRELQERLKAQEKKVDYFERAKRLEEIPILQKNYETQRVHDAELWDKLEEEKIDSLKQEQALALEHKKRLSRMAKDRDAFMDHLRRTRAAVYEEEMEAFKKVLEEQRKMRLQKRKEARKLERRQTREKEKEEERQRKIDEEIKRKRDEEERKRREEEEAERKAYEDRLKMLKEQEEKQREREREIEEKLRKTQITEDSAPERGVPPKWAAARGGEDRAPSWRSREDSNRQDVKPGGDSWRSRGGDGELQRDQSPPPSNAWRPRRASPSRDRPVRDFGADRGSRDFGSRPRGSDREARDFDRPAGRDFGDRGPSRDFGDRGPSRDFGDRGPSRDFGDRGPSRDFGDRGPSRDFGDRGPSRDFGDRGPSRDFGDRGPSRDFGDRGPSRDFGDRGPSRDFGDRGTSRDFGDRGPSRDFGDRGPSRDFGDSPRGFSDRSRDQDRVPPRGGAAPITRRDDGGSWRRRSPSPRQAPAGGTRRSSPPGRSRASPPPPGRRDSPQGRSPPPTGRRSSPAGRRSPPASARPAPAWRTPAVSGEQGGWRDSRAPEKAENVWTRGGGAALRSGEKSSAPPSVEKSQQSWRPSAGAWRPSRARGGDSAAPPAGDNPREEAKKREDGDDEWTTVRR